MSLPQYQSAKMAEAVGLVSMAEIARMVERDKRTVDMWIRRRRTSHFPDHVAFLVFGSRLIPLYKKKEVQDWHAQYIPSKGGAPKGNRNWIPKHKKSTS
jgi:hypothetical protein